MNELEDSRRDAKVGSFLQAVTFDLTHTLIHSLRLAEIYRRVLSRHGIEVDEGRLRPEMGWVWKELSCRADPRRDRFTAHPRGPWGWWRFTRWPLLRRFTRARKDGG